MDIKRKDQKQYVQHMFVRVQKPFSLLHTPNPHVHTRKLLSNLRERTTAVNPAGQLTTGLSITTLARATWTNHPLL